MSENRLKDILDEDDRYDLEAYKFVLEGLEQIQTNVSQPRHISGEELLDGIKELALDEFGPLGGMVFRCWGIRDTEDIGNIVFNLVDHGLMGKRDTDSIEDFKNGYDIDSVFWNEYREQFSVND